MYFLDNTFCTDAPTNLALEEVLFNSDLDDDLLMFWQNENAVIIGRNQFTLDEINYDLVKKDNVQVVRRNSGGGAVYHDLGNLNFSYITSNENFDFYGPVISALKTLGIEVIRSGRNDLTIENKKISGTAVYKKKGKILYHGTILFDSDLTKMPKYLSVSDTKLSKRHIASVLSRVTNLKEYLPEITISKLKQILLNSFQKNSSVKTLYSDKYIKEAEKLATLKFKKEDWNYGQNPKDYKKIKFISKVGEIFIFLQIENDRIKDINFYGDFFSDQDVGEFEVLCKNKKIEELKQYQDTSQKYFNGLNKEEYLALIESLKGI